MWMGVSGVEYFGDQFLCAGVVAEFCVYEGFGLFKADFLLEFFQGHVCEG